MAPQSCRLGVCAISSFSRNLKKRKAPHPAETGGPSVRCEDPGAQGVRQGPGPPRGSAFPSAILHLPAALLCKSLASDWKMQRAGARTPEQRLKVRGEGCVGRCVQIFQLFVESGSHRPGAASHVGPAFSVHWRDGLDFFAAGARRLRCSCWARARLTLRQRSHRDSLPTGQGQPPPLLLPLEAGLRACFCGPGCPRRLHRGFRPQLSSRGG